MAKLDRIEKRANRKAAEKLERQQKLNLRQRERGLEEDRRKILSENRRTVRDTYDNATALYKRRKNFRRHLMYAMLGLFLCCLGVLTLSFLLFQVKQVNIIGNTVYDEQELRETIGLQGGENMLLVDMDGIADRLCVAYPYIESVEVRRKWPDTISFTVTEAENAYAVPIEGKEGNYALLSAGEKVLSCTDTLPSGELCTVSGVLIVDPEPGYTARYSESTDTSLLHNLILSLKNNGLEELDTIDLSDPVDISVTYEGRLLIRIGTAASLDYKLQFAKKLIDEEIDPKQGGTVDVRNASLRKASFQPSAAPSAENADPPSGEEPEVSTGPMTDEGDYSLDAERPYRGF